MTKTLARAQQFDFIRPSNILAVPFCELTPVGLSLPDDLTAEQWLEAGLALGRAQGVMMWAIGDWWAFGEHKYGERAATVSNGDWEGPPFQTCADAAYVCRRFETSTRVEVLSWRMHRAVAPIEDEEWRLKTLAWASEQKHTRAEIEQRVKEVKAHLAQGWTADQAERKAQAESGLCVVANMREESGRQIDGALLAWAEANDRLVRIDRQTDWGNPFEMPEDGEREEVVAKFSKFYLPHKNGLLCAIPSLRGKVLSCWCHPQECHGHIIAEIVNREAAGDGTVEALADQIADYDG